MRPRTPTVVEGADLAGMLDYLTKKRGPATLVVCSSRDEFIHALRTTTTYQNLAKPGRADHVSLSDAESAEEKPPARPLSYDLSSLRHLAALDSGTLAFCPSVPHLRAYLSTYLGPASKMISSTNARYSTDRSVNQLLILNLVQLHRRTSALSAQGIQRTLSNVVEAGHRSSSYVVLAECPLNRYTVITEHTETFDEPLPTAEPYLNPWDEEISILNVTTKTFRVGERGWAGRTVKIRQIAARWCTFQAYLPV